MSVSFTKASSTSLTTTLAGTFPTTPPFTVGGWFRVRTADGLENTLWSCGDAVSDFFEIRKNAADTFIIMDANDGTAGTEVDLVGIFSAGGWMHLICRWISVSNRRATGLALNGAFAVSNSQIGVILNAPSGMVLGARRASVVTNFSDVDIADFWWTSVDVGNSVVTDLTYAQHLSFISPQNNPQQARKLRLFQSFRSGWEQRDPENRLPQWTPSATKPVGGQQPPWVQLPLWNRKAAYGFVPVVAPTLFPPYRSRVQSYVTRRY